MRCQKCNAENPDQASFCKVCGARIIKKDELQKKQNIKETIAKLLLITIFALSLILYQLRFDRFILK